MEDHKIIDRIVEALRNLEQEGELVLTTAFPQRVAETLFHTTMKTWVETALTTDDPIECTMPRLLTLTVRELRRRFGVEEMRARDVVNTYYNEWLKTRSIAQVAEIYWHETPQEMAGRAYYHIVLGKPDSHDLDYLDWRRRQYAVEKS